MKITFETQQKLIKSLNSHFLSITALLFICLFGAQFIVLATVGTKGIEVSKIRAEKDYYRIENERIRSEIDRARTLANIEVDINQVFDQPPVRFSPREIKVDNIDALGFSALNNR